MSSPILLSHRSDAMDVDEDLDLWINTSHKTMLTSIKEAAHPNTSQENITKNHTSQKEVSSNSLLSGRKTLEDLSNIRGDSAASSGSIHRLTSLREMYHTASLLDEGDPLLATPTPKRLSGIPAALQSTTTPIASPVLSRKSSAKRKILPPSPKSPAMRLSEGTLALSSPGDISSSASKRRKLSENIEASLAMSPLVKTPLKSTFDSASSSSSDSAQPKESPSPAVPLKGKRTKRVGMIQMEPIPESAEQETRNPEKFAPPVAAPVASAVAAAPTAAQKPLVFSSANPPTRYADIEKEREKAAEAAAPKRTRADRMSLLPAPGFMARRQSLMPMPSSQMRGAEAIVHSIPKPFDHEAQNAAPVSQPPTRAVAPAAAPATVAKSTASTARFGKAALEAAKSSAPVATATTTNTATTVTRRVTRQSAKAAEIEQKKLQQAAAAAAPPKPEVPIQPAVPKPVVASAVPAAVAATPSVGPSPVRTLRSRVVRRVIEPVKSAPEPAAPVVAPAPTAPQTAKKVAPAVSVSQTTRKIQAAASRRMSVAPNFMTTPPKAHGTSSSSMTSTVKKHAVVPRTQLKPELRRARMQLQQEPSFENRESLQLFEKQLEEALRLGTASAGVGAYVRATVEDDVIEEAPKKKDITDDDLSPVKSSHTKK